MINKGTAKSGIESNPKGITSNPDTPAHIPTVRITIRSMSSSKTSRISKGSDLCFGCVFSRKLDKLEARQKIALRKLKTYHSTLVHNAADPLSESSTSSSSRSNTTNVDVVGRHQQASTEGAEGTVPSDAYRRAMDRVMLAAAKVPIDLTVNKPSLMQYFEISDGIYLNQDDKCWVRKHPPPGSIMKSQANSQYWRRELKLLGRRKEFVKAAKISRCRLVGAREAYKVSLADLRTDIETLRKNTDLY